VKKKGRIGSSFDDFLKQEGIYSIQCDLTVCGPAFSPRPGRRVVRGATGLFRQDGQRCKLSIRILSDARTRGRGVTDAGAVAAWGDSITCSITCSDFWRRLYWFSSALECVALRQGSAMRTATTPITTVRSTLPMLSHTCSLTLAVTSWEIALLKWSTPHPAFAGGRSRCDFREQRRYASHSELAAVRWHRRQMMAMSDSERSPAAFCELA
jgi:hypothetical protein